MPPVELPGYVTCDILEASLTFEMVTAAFEMVTAAKDPKQAIGRAPERLTLEERFALVGKYVALEIYTPEKLPLRRIEAIGDGTGECVRQLVERGLDPTQFEFSRLAPPYV